MCLIVIRGEEAIIAEEDIVVYKLMLKWKDNEPKYYTLFQHMPVHIGAQYNLEYHDVESFHKGIQWGEVAIGFHSFDKDSILRYSNYLGRSLSILKCIIPKGSYYIKGIFESAYGNFTSYASTSIKYLEETEDYIMRDSLRDVCHMPLVV